jgi:hypothetical protein
MPAKRMGDILPVLKYEWITLVRWAGVKLDKVHTKRQGVDLNFMCRYNHEKFKKRTMENQQTLLVK